MPEGSYDKLLKENKELKSQSKELKNQSESEVEKLDRLEQWFLNFFERDPNLSFMIISRPKPQT